MNKGIHLDLGTWIVPGQILKSNLCCKVHYCFNNNKNLRYGIHMV